MAKEVPKRAVKMEGTLKGKLGGMGRKSSNQTPERLETLDYAGLILDVIGGQPGHYDQRGVINRVIRRYGLDRALERSLGVVYEQLQDRGQINTYEIDGKERAFPRGASHPKSSE